MKGKKEFLKQVNNVGKLIYDGMRVVKSIRLRAKGRKYEYEKGQNRPQLQQEHL